VEIRTEKVKTPETSNTGFLHTLFLCKMITEALAIFLCSFQTHSTVSLGTYGTGPWTGGYRTKEMAVPKTGTKKVKDIKMYTQSKCY
jgi:hypothetical protein